MTLAAATKVVVSCMTITRIDEPSVIQVARRGDPRDRRIQGRLCGVVLGFRVWAPPALASIEMVARTAIALLLSAGCQAAVSPPVASTAPPERSAAASSATPVPRPTALKIVWQVTEGIEQPTGLALDTDGRVVVVDFAANAVHRLSPDGKLLESWGTSGSKNGELAGAAGVAVGPDGALYVADHDNYRIQKFAPDGTFALAWGGRGTNPGQFDGPNGIAVGPDGLVYVSEDTNARVQIFQQDGTLVRAWIGAGDEKFGDPTGIAFSGDRVFVGDFKTNKIWTLDHDGKLLGTIGEPGGGDGQFSGVSMLATDTAGHVYVTDYDNGRIQKFDPSGKHLATYVLEGGRTFGRPFGLAIGPDGDIYVAEYQARRVDRLHPAG